jgi:hypothetical protein
MNCKTLESAKIEAVRFINKVALLESAIERESKEQYACNTPKESGAVRRASMDLTRALAELRKPDYL